MWQFSPQGHIDRPQLHHLLLPPVAFELLSRRLGQLARLLGFSAEFDAVLSQHGGLHPELADCVVGHSGVLSIVCGLKWDLPRLATAPAS